MENSNTQLPAEVAPKKYNTQNLLNANEAKKNSHQTFLDRIVVSESGCWEWQHNKDSRGYGQISINGTYWKAHRYSYRHFKGDIGGLNVLHKCDNPACCNPDHLFLGNQSENAIDMFQKGRSRIAKTTPEQVMQIRDLFASGLKRKEISEICGTSRAVVENVIKGKSWAHITNSASKYIVVNSEEYVCVQEKLRQMEQEIAQLKRWKVEATELLSPILEYGQSKEAGIPLGERITEVVLDRCKQTKQAKQLLFRLTSLVDAEITPDDKFLTEIKTFLDGK